MLDFIQKYWPYVALVISCISLIVNIIVFFVKKVPVGKIFKVLAYIPILINTSEKLFPLSDMGDTKKTYVKSMFNDLLVRYGIEKFGKYFDIDLLIEDFLSTPQRKEDIL